ncbi:UNVERIFIED_CONTAM: hypothetical protein GTU68_004607 [Idotea baltica]|nr:hypothetical protein [Idotea baltica]
MIATAFLLILVMDPFGNIIALNTLLSEIDPKKRFLIILREGAIAATILLVASFAGKLLLRFLGLEEHSLQLAGGIVLFLIALGMLFPSRKILDVTPEESPLIVPIAMPLIAGPSAISMVILLSEKESPVTVSGAILIAAGLSTALLAGSTRIFSFLGRRGATAMERLMGILLIIVSVQMILDGISAFLATLS